jgi:hypothetical protein
MAIPTLQLQLEMFILYQMAVLLLKRSAIHHHYKPVLTPVHYLALMLALKSTIHHLYIHVHKVDFLAHKVLSQPVPGAQF